MGKPTAAMAREAADLLRGAGSVLVVGHKSPDGDSIGTQLAMGRLLDSYANRVTLLAADPVPSRYAWMPGSDRVRVTERSDETFDLVLALECANLERTGIAGITGHTVINIDHHQQNDHYGRLNWVDPGFSSVGEMLCLVARELTGGAPFPAESATCFYTAILTDTGSFRYSNTTPSALATAGDLVAQGAEPAEVARAIYENHPAARLLLMGRVLSSLTFDEDGRIGWVTVSQVDLRESGAAPEDVEGLIELPRSIGALEVVALFREQPDGSYRVSLRSKRVVDVSAVAAAFGGGGHTRAAGLSAAGPLESAVDAVTGALRRAFSDASGD